MITGAVIGREALIVRLRNSLPLTQRIATEVQKLGYEIERRVKAEKLSGQVLRVRTGLLRSSISHGGPQSVSHFEQDANGATYTIGTAVKYAAVHEYGFDGLVSVRPYVRHTYKISMRTSRGGVSRRVKGEVTGYAYVRGFIRHMRMPERSYLRSTLGESENFIVERIRIAAGEGMRAMLGQS